MTHTHQKLVLILLGLTLLSACRGGSSSSSFVEPVVPIEPAALPDINPAQVELVKLRPVMGAELLNSLQNGSYAKNGGVEHSETVLEADVAAAPSMSQRDFSVTVTQENGVDEADIIKYNGTHLFAIASWEGEVNAKPLPEISATSVPYVDNQITGIRVLAKQGDNSLAALAPITFDKTTPNFTPAELYLYNDTLVSTLINQVSYYDVGLFLESSSTFGLHFFDVSVPENITSQVLMEIEGNLLTTRRVDNRLIVISSHVDTSGTVRPLATTDEQRRANLAYFEALDLDVYLPEITLTQSGETSTTQLVNAEQCYVPENYTDSDGYYGLLTMTVIDLDNPAEFISTCVNGLVDGVYATPDDIFLYGTQYQYTDDSGASEQTVVHHFDRDPTQGFNYNGSAIVDGHLGWNNPHLRFSANATHLRVVSTQTTTDIDDRLDHTLSIYSLAAQDRLLPKVGGIPNAIQPNEIGKPNEDITAVRYFGDTAYVVTFERIDPLYVIDLRDPTSPAITGELEMPGFSSYLQPISEAFVLGVGQNVDPQRFLEDSFVTEAEVEEGTKIALFDVSGEPRIVNEVIYPNSATPAEFNYKALTYLPKSATEHWFALPVIAWSFNREGDFGYSETYSLELLSVDVSATPFLQSVGRVMPESPNSHYYGNWQDRAVIDGQTIFYFRAGYFYYSDWFSPNVVQGPY
jgi:hypothetical protein